MESTRVSIQEILDNNFDLQRLQQTLQRFAFNIQILKNENQRLYGQVTGASLSGE